MILSVCFIYFVGLGFLSIICFFSSIYFMICDWSVVLEYELFTLNSNIVCMSVLFDWMSLLFMSFVLFISCMVIFYSDEYMEGDLTLHRFILLVVMFVASMMFLIISPNLISILLGWDGLGLVSYCLVIYYQNFKSYNAGMITALSNRIGDVALLMSIAWMLNYGDWNYIYYLDYAKSDLVMGVVGGLVVLAALTKSAQIPFSSWLPAAMAAPTPVSALVHSSTLVTAGVYLLIRFGSGLNDYLTSFLLFVSVLTMFMAGLGANYEFDLKKIIALSTLSQLGLMMSILALGDYFLAFFHLLTHALFKALLFMCAGCMIHNLSGVQDVRYMGGLISQMPVTCCYFNVCNMALCGLPFLSGFYSKDLILEAVSMGWLNWFVYLCFYFSTGLTVCYSVRLSYYSVIGDYNFYSTHNVSDSGLVMLKGMSGLILLVVVGGSVLSWLLFPTPYFVVLPQFMKLMVVMVLLLGFYVGYEFSKFLIGYSLKGLRYLYSSLFFSSMWNLPVLSTFGVNYYPVHLGGVYYQGFDHGWSEYFGSQNIYNNMVGVSKVLQFLSVNSVKVYLSFLVVWVLWIFLFL
uniref:NADH-ubiquinone oxidoreductase chain 5 n=1 Tax=Pyrearinus termitilluminans TaxID=109589 RepID=A0A158V1H6_9COLE|nr:NADH dehydrogenase subunit 5 [Pyrearinus termitilluminans]AIQ80129.1 NADH dehydrogenase subunit 5 [Pyrearinus termitilluminans]